GFIRQTLCDVVMGDGGFVGVLDHAVSSATSILPMKSEQGVVSQRIANIQANDPAAQINVDELDPIGQVDVEVRWPVPDDNNVAQISEGDSLEVLISGVARAFVQETLGVPSRVQVHVNGILVPTSPANWQPDNGGRMHLSMP